MPSVAQLRRLYTLVVGSDPRQLQFDLALWTRDIVRQLIRREFDVALSAVSVGRLLHRLGLSVNTPFTTGAERGLRYARNGEGCAGAQ